MFVEPTSHKVEFIGLAGPFGATSISGVDDLASQVSRMIRHHRLLRPGERVLAAVSGGLDSMVLLSLLHRLAASHRWRLIVAHFNHQLRGKANDADEEMVRRVSRRLGWPCVVGRGDVSGLAREKGVSIEMAARRLRHEFLAQTARQHQIRSIALAHHADDQVELFFIRLLRGSGLDGFGGMKRQNPSPADPRIRLVRPLLDLDKETLKSFADAQKIPFKEDASNASLDIPRNRLRHELLPLLRKHYQGSLNRVILRTMRSVGEATNFILQQSQDWLDSSPRTAFSRLHPALQSSVLREQLTMLGLSPDQDLIEFLGQNPLKWIMVAPGIRVRRNRGGVLIKDHPTSSTFRSNFRELDLGECPGTAVFEGTLLNWKTGPSSRALPPPMPRLEYFDADRVGSKIILRHWQPGDRFHPIGMHSPVKLQDWFTNRKVPSDARRKVLIGATAGGEIFWVEGQRISDRFKVTSKTRRLLRWKWRRRV